MNDATLVFVLSGLAGLLALDSTAVLQIMISQPIVAGTIAGLMCGDAATGLAVGGVLQLIWLGALPVGAAGFPDAPLGTVVGVGVAALMLRSGSGTGWAMPLGLASALLVGEAGRLLVSAVRRANIRLSDAAVADANAGDRSGVGRAVIRGIGLRFATATALSLAALAVALAAIRATGFHSPREAFPAYVWAAPIAAAIVAHRCGRSIERGLMAAGFLVGLVFVTFG